MNTCEAELMRTWTDPDGLGFEVRLLDTHIQDDEGRRYVTYHLLHHGQRILEGTIGVPRHETTDGDRTLATALSFCSLRPGDTDRCYFDSYSEEQLAWAIEHGETLSIYALELEEGCA